MKALSGLLHRLPTVGALTAPTIPNTPTAEAV